MVDQSSEATWRQALHRFAAEMRSLYGDRLQQVILYGSRARGDAQDDSDIDTLIVLKPLGDFWAELSRIGTVASRVSLEHDVVISAIPVDAADLRKPATPLLLITHREGVRVA